MATIDWYAEFGRGALGFGVLCALSSGPLHGYELMGRLRSAGFPSLKSGTMYPLLRRLEDRGLLAHEWVTRQPGAARKVFRLTDLGALEEKAAWVSWAGLESNLRLLRSQEGGT